MAKRRRPVTPFRRWYKANGEPHPQTLADHLKINEGSIRHYLAGRAIPKPETLKGLREMTGLPLEAFLYPFEPLPESQQSQGGA